MSEEQMKKVVRQGLFDAELKSMDLSQWIREWRDEFMNHGELRDTPADKMEEIVRQGALISRFDMEHARPKAPFPRDLRSQIEYNLRLGITRTRIYEPSITLGEIQSVLNKYYGLGWDARAVSAFEPDEFILSIALGRQIG